MPDVTLRLTTDASLTAILEERPFFLGDTLTLLLGPDETVPSAVGEVGRRFIEETIKYWRDWVRRLAIPFEWQGAVIRAAITLQQNAYDDTGAIVAAMTTSIPEAAGSARNWDYRYCWLRDGYFVVDALNRLGATDTMERYLGYIVNIAAGAAPAPLQPVYRINGDAALGERRRRVAAGLPRHGPGARRQRRLPAGAARRLRLRDPRRDARLLRRAAGQAAATRALFERLEALGRRALAVSTTSPTPACGSCAAAPRVHTFSSVMCWAACDRLARIAARLGLAERARGVARRRRAHPPLRRASAAGATTRQQLRQHRRRRHAGREPAAARRPRLRRADDPRFAATVRAIERELKRGDFIFRYVERDDFGEPENAFVVCTFWYVNALAAIGRRDEARALFERLLALPQPARPARRAPRPGDRRALGQLRADLQHGRADHLGDPAVGALGRGRSERRGRVAPREDRRSGAAPASRAARRGSSPPPSASFAVSAASIRSHSACDSATLIVPGTSRWNSRKRRGPALRVRSA